MGRILLCTIILHMLSPAFGQVVIPKPEALWQVDVRYDAGFVPCIANFSLEGHYVVVWNGLEIHVIDTTTKDCRTVHQDQNIAACWTCPQTGGLFVVTRNTNREQIAGRRTTFSVDSHGVPARLDYLKEPGDWFDWKVTWSIPIFYRGIGVQFLENSGHVAILEREPFPTTSKGRPVGSSATTRFSYVRLFDRFKLESGDSSAQVGRIQVPGLVGAWSGWTSALPPSIQSRQIPSMTVQSFEPTSTFRRKNSANQSSCASSVIRC